MRNSTRRNIYNTPGHGLRSWRLADSGEWSCFSKRNGATSHSEKLKKDMNMMSMVVAHAFDPSLAINAFRDVLLS